MAWQLLGADLNGRLLGRRLRGRIRLDSGFAPPSDFEEAETATAENRQHKLAR